MAAGPGTGSRTSAGMRSRSGVGGREEVAAEEGHGRERRVEEER